MLNSELQLPNSSLCPDDPEQSGASKIVSAIVVIGKLMGIKVISEPLVDSCNRQPLGAFHYGICNSY